MSKALDVGECDGRELPSWIDCTGVTEKAVFDAVTNRYIIFHDREEVGNEALLPLSCDQRW